MTITWPLPARHLPATCPLPARYLPVTAGAAGGQAAGGPAQEPKHRVAAGIAGAPCQIRVAWCHAKLGSRHRVAPRQLRTGEPMAREAVCCKLLGLRVHVILRSSPFPPHPARRCLPQRLKPRSLPELLAAGAKLGVNLVSETPPSRSIVASPLRYR